jgi:hypothetical protein
MVDELAAIGFTHAVLDGADLPLVEFHEPPDGLRDQGCAAAVGCLAEPVEALAGGSVEPEGYGFTHCRLPLHNTYIVYSRSLCVNPAPFRRWRLARGVRDEG